MAITHGMNIEEVRGMGNRLKQEADNIRNVMNSLSSLVQNSAWEGPDAQKFKGPWWDEKRASLTAISEQLDGFGQSALNNASAQESASQG